MKTIKCEYCDGCMSFSTTIDGTELVDMDIDKLKKYIQYIIPLVDDVAILQNVFCRVLESRGNTDGYGICEECGDAYYKYSLDLEVNE